MSGTDVRLVVTTVGSDGDAERIASDIVRGRYAACVNILRGVESWYRWQDRIENARECLLVMKTTRDRAPELRRRVADLHPYEVPEIIEFDVVDGHAPYLAWVKACCDPDAGPCE